MSELLNDNSNFLSLLLNTSSDQQKALLDTVTADQAKLISEIFLNILDIEHDDNNIKFLKNKVPILETLSKSSVSNRYRRSYIKTHKRVILKIILFFKKELTNLL